MSTSIWTRYLVFHISQRYYRILCAQPTLDGQTIVSLSADARFCGRSFFRSENHFYYGRCHSLEVPDCLQDLSLSELVVTLNTATDVYVHDRFNFHNPATNFKLSVDLGQFRSSHQFQFSSLCGLGTTSRVSLKIDQEQRMAEDCEPVGYHYDQCLDRSIRQLLKEKTNCTVPWLYQNKDICKVRLELVDIGTTNVCIHQDKYSQRIAFKLYQENRKNQRKLCRDSCLQNKLGFGPINSDKIKEATVHGRIVVSLPKNIRLNSEKQLYTLGMM